jgi:hypothetical protein
MTSRRGALATSASGRFFCERVARGKAKPSCVIDFPFADNGGLNLVGDDRLLERMYASRTRRKGIQVDAWW